MAYARDLFPAYGIGAMVKEHSAGELIRLAAQLLHHTASSRDAQRASARGTIPHKGGRHRGDNPRLGLQDDSSPILKP